MCVLNFGYTENAFFLVQKEAKKHLLKQIPIFDKKSIDF